jgi:hypothetical protein
LEAVAALIDCCAQGKARDVSRRDRGEGAGQEFTRSEETMYTILLIILILLLLGALPTWPYSRAWGYYPSGGLGLIVLIVIILLLVRAV